MWYRTDFSNMRIALLNTFDVTGGAARAALRLHDGLNRIGVRHAYLVARKEADDQGIVAVRPENAAERTDWAEREGDVRGEEAPYAALRVPGFIPFHSERAARAQLLEQRLRRMRLHDAEVMNLHWTRGLVDWQTFLAHRSASQALIWTLHDEHPLAGGCHYSYGCEGSGRGCGGCPVLGSDDADDLSAVVFRRKQAALAGFTGALHLVAPSRWMAGQAASSALFRNRPVHVIPNGIDTERFHPQPGDRVRHGISPTDLVVLFIAHRLDDPRKGYEHLRAALDQLEPDRNVVLVTAGEGDTIPPRCVRTIHLGLLDDDQALVNAYALADVVVVPSEQDNQPNCCLEAMACGKAVLAFPTGGLSDMVVNGETGILTADTTRDALAQGLAGCLKSQEALAAMGHQGRRRVLREYTLEMQAQRYNRLYEDAHRETAGAQRKPPERDCDRHARILGITPAFGGFKPVSLGVWDFLLRLQADWGMTGHMLEIGVFQGAAAAALAWHLGPDERYCGIDIHLQDELVCANVGSLVPSAVSRLDLIETSSAVLARNGLPAVFQGACRFLHVDGEHSYDAVRRDLDLCFQAMGESGIIAVDDFANPESVCVAHAVFDHLRDNPHRLRLFLCGGNKAYLCAPPALGLYRQACLKSLVPTLEHASGQKIRLAKNSHAWEVDYLSFTERGEGTPYMEIGRYVHKFASE